MVLQDGVGITFECCQSCSDRRLQTCASRQSCMLMAKLDVASSYWNVAIHPEDSPLLGIKWQGKDILDIISLVCGDCVGVNCKYHHSAPLRKKKFTSSSLNGGKLIVNLVALLHKSQSRCPSSLQEWSRLTLPYQTLPYLNLQGIHVSLYIAVNERCKASEKLHTVQS